ncbi:MAG: methylated-DNA--[protein]-cysteine S-methyltransferase [Erysipelotrichaceae bacterium]|nr:methylated-DNA--[protein]-cysteine S-methyltransferase [Erysipelotrichaceae bacterium]
MKYAYCYQSPIGALRIIETDDKIIGVDFFDKLSKEHTLMETVLIKKTYQQLLEYFAGKRHIFSIDIKLIGTPFQVAVWNQLIKIPYGQTCSYKYIAQRIEKPKAYRAVGMANNRNPISIIVPCHRVIGANGKLVGYGGGLDVKAKLLDLEKSVLDNLDI